MNTSFEKALEIYFPGGIGYVMEQVSKFPADTWIKPTNKDSKDYMVFSNLFEYNLVARKFVPQWKDGRFKGAQVYFKYNHDLKFEET